MPELPEVESFRRYMDDTSLNKDIKEVKIKSVQILQNISDSNLKEKLEDKRFIDTKRYGKYLFARLNTDSWLVLHFGMTGRFKYFEDNKSPPYDRMVFNFADGSSLAFVDPRKFGKINFTSKMEDFIGEKKLGPDALNISFNTFKNLYHKKKGASKAALMNQHIMAGIGNIYSDEILYQACVHPKTPFNALDNLKIKEIFNTMNEVLQTAIDRQLHRRKLPDSYIIPNRLKGGKCPGLDIDLKTIKIAGRTSYYCPKCQKE